MRKAFLGIICAICVLCHLRAEVYDHTFRFSESDFSISPSAGDSLVIVSLASPAVYNGETQPGIPLLARSLAIPQGYTVHDYSVSFKKRLIRSGVDLRNAARPIPTNAPAEEMWAFPGGYAPKVYPDTNCVNSTSYQIGGVTVAGFIVSPFIFDAAERNLYFIDSLTVSLDLDASTMRKAPALIRPNQLEMLDAVVENREILGQIPVLTAESDDVEYIDYIIITSNALKSSFQPLADWKCKKGVRTKIVTVEEIDQNYTESTQQMRIKACIKDYWTNNYTQYVLLGGDVDIVPAQHCYVYKSKLYQAEIPTDLYYSALQDLDWEIAKKWNSEFFPYSRLSIAAIVDVTRIPVRNAAGVTAFVNRIIEYEKNPNYTRDFFQCGTKLSTEKNIEGETLANLFFNNVISYKVILGANKIFNTYSYSGEPLNSQTIKSELSKGYQFAQFFSHGEPDGWCDEDGSYFFKTTDAASLDNAGHTFISTMACSTNAFDHGYIYNINQQKVLKDPCLSEALLRNPSSGVIGFLGASREGWYNNALDFSMAYETEFHKRLHYNNNTSRPLEKNLGKLLTFTKLSIMPLAEYIPKVVTEQDSIHNLYVTTYRWLHYAINAMGDPETPIFNVMPQEIKSAYVHSPSSKTLIVKPCLDGARVCVSSSGKGSYYKVFSNIMHDEEVTFEDLDYDDYDIWITKQNYKPLHLSYRLSMVPHPENGSHIVSALYNPRTQQATVKYMCLLDRAKPNIQIVFTNINGKATYTFNAPAAYYPSGQEHSFDIGHFPTGIYIVTLIENGIISGISQQFYKS